MQQVENVRVVLAGIGGDSHSVGLTLLRHGLSAAGYQVRYLGIQTRQSELVDAVPGADFVLLSNMDGHARLYLRDFSQVIGLTSDTFWYLGGNIAVGNREAAKASFLEMGFHRVFPAFADLKIVLEVLRADGMLLDPLKLREPGWDALGEWAPDAWQAVSSGKVPKQEFDEVRESVLLQWKTGHAARALEDNARALTTATNMAKIQARRRSNMQSRILLQPRSGVATVAAQANLFRALSAGGADVLSFQIDSLTRNNAYAAVAEVLNEGEQIALQTLNGFPMVNHGVDVVRQIAHQENRPFQTRHSTRDPRLLAEVSMAGGVSGFEGGPICYNIPYYKDLPLSASLKSWKYVDRLAGRYFEDFGLVIDREFFGTLTGTLIPPSIAISINILEVLLAAEQGVRSVSVGYAEQGCRKQDVAAIATLGKMCNAWLSNAGFKEVSVNTVFHQYMAAFPADADRARQLIVESAKTAAEAGATRLLVKTAVEAVRIPSSQDNVEALILAATGADVRPSRSNESEVETEARQIEFEVNQILERVFMLGSGVIEQGIVRGFQQGILDVPFSPSIYNKGQVQTVRGVDGAVRFLRFGNLPFTSDTRDLHIEAVAKRRERDRELSRASDTELVEHDVLRIPRGEYVGWPLGD